MWKSMLYFLLIAVTLNANMAPTSSKSGNIVDFSQNPSSPSSLAKVYVDVEKIKREVNFITAYLPRDKKITSCFGNSSDICKINATQCDSIYEDPSCPDNGTLNTVRNMCQKPSVDSCPVGYIYDNSIDRCVISVVCPDGGTFNGATDRCEKVVLDKCPTDYSLDATNSVCWKAVTCNNPSAVFNPDRDRCEMPMNIGCDDGYAYNPSTYQCERTPTCSKGIYNNTYNKCLADYVEKCDTANGYTYNTTSKQCEKTPSCQAGTSYNATTNRCEGGSACSTGTWNSTTQKCESSVVGVAGEYTVTSYGWVNQDFYAYPFDPIINATSFSTDYTRLAEIYPVGIGFNNQNHTINFGLLNGPLPISTIMSMPEKQYVQYDYSSQNYPIDSCYMISAHWRTLNGIKRIELNFADTCWNGSFGAIYNLAASSTCPPNTTQSGANCISSTAGTCPAGLTANPTTGICTANPTCPISNGFGAATFDGNIDKCYTATQKDCSLNPGYVYDIASNKCSGDANCTGGLLDVNTDKCFKSACPTNYSFNTATKACEANPICSNNSIYNTTYDKCLIDFTPSCDTTSGYTYNTASKQCERTPSCQAGTSYNATTNRCEGGSACSTGTWNSTTKMCESTTPVVNGGLPSNGEVLLSLETEVDSYRNTTTFSGTMLIFTQNEIIARRVAFGLSGYTSCHLLEPANYTSNILLYNFFSTNKGFVFPKNTTTPATVYSSSFSWNADTQQLTVASNQVIDFKNKTSTSSLFRFENGQLTATPTTPSTTWWGASTTFYEHGSTYYDGSITASFPISQPASIASYDPPGLDIGWGRYSSFTSCDNQTYNNATQGRVYTKASLPIGSCPPGSTLSGSSCITSTPGTCPAGLTANPTTGICTANPTCPISNGFGTATFDGNIDKCWTTYITTCGNGFMYDSALKMCVKDVDCNNSKAILNTTTEKCQITIGDCGALNFDTTKNICFSDPMCDLGAYNDSHIRCEASVSKDCATYTYDSSSSKCYKQINCPTDEHFIHKNSIAYSNELNKCVSFAEHICPNNYTYNGLPIAMCEAIPICSGGVYNPENDRCFTGQRVCPIGNFSCLPSGQEYWCSPYKCDAQAQCGTATCANGTVGSKSIQDSSKCYAHICDTSMPYNEYCGEDACPTGFGVYKESGKCYQDVCPTGSSQNGTGACQTLKCPFGTSEVNGQCFENN